MAESLDYKTLWRKAKEKRRKAEEGRLYVYIHGGHLEIYGPVYVSDRVVEATCRMRRQSSLSIDLVLCISIFAVFLFPSV
jgi:hypothetical protein